MRISSLFLYWNQKVKSFLVLKLLDRLVVYQITLKQKKLFLERLALQTNRIQKNFFLWTVNLFLTIFICFLSKFNFLIFFSTISTCHVMLLSSLWVLEKMFIKQLGAKRENEKKSTLLFGVFVIERGGGGKETIKLSVFNLKLNFFLFFFVFILILIFNKYFPTELSLKGFLGSVCFFFTCPLQIVCTCCLFVDIFF